MLPIHIRLLAMLQVYINSQTDRCVILCDWQNDSSDIILLLQQQQKHQHQLCFGSFVLASVSRLVASDASQAKTENTAIFVSSLVTLFVQLSFAELWLYQFNLFV